MRQHKTIVWALSLYGCLLLDIAPSYGNDVFAKVVENSGVRVTLGALTITNRAVGLRCDVRNETGQDIWIYDGNPNENDLNGVRGTNAEIYVGKDDQTLVVLRRINRPLHGIRSGPVYGAYARLHTGQSRPQAFFVALPVVMRSPSLQGFDQAISRGIDTMAQLAFEIGYYTAEDMRLLEASPGPFGRIRFESADQMRIYDQDHARIPSSERAIRMTVEGVYVPYKQWFQQEKPVATPEPPVVLLGGLSRVFFENRQILPASEYRYAKGLLEFDPNLFDGPTQQIADVYIALAEGRLAPADLIQHLDSIMSKADREELPDKLFRQRALASAPEPPRLTAIQALEDLFYNFAVDLEEYRYAKELFAIDEDLLEGPARQIADIYIQVAQGKLSPSELTARLDTILSKSEREGLLRELQERQTGAAERH